MKWLIGMNPDWSGDKRSAPSCVIVMVCATTAYAAQRVLDVWNASRVKSLWGLVVPRVTSRTSGAALRCHSGWFAGWCATCSQRMKTRIL